MTLTNLQNGDFTTLPLGYELKKRQKRQKNYYYLLFGSRINGYQRDREFSCALVSFDINEFAEWRFYYP
ncbi:MAG: hypothetical protein AB1567_11745 [bacterium]